MRKSEIALSLALLGSASAAIWLWTELRDERSRNRELTARVASLPTLNVSPVVAPAVTLPKPSSTDEVSPATPFNATSPVPVERGEQEEAEASQRRRLQQPEYREAWRAQMRLNYTLRRDNVIRLLGFTPEEADAIVELEIERRLSWIDRAADRPMSDQSVELFEQGKREDESKLREVLGDAKFSQFQEYMESRSTRIYVEQLLPRFTGADTLRDEQVEPLIAALHVERNRLQTEQQEYRHMASADDSPSIPQNSERELELLKAAHERMHTAVAPVLSASQLKRFDVLQQRELEKQELEARMQSGVPEEDVANSK